MKLLNQIRLISQHQWSLKPIFHNNNSKLKDEKIT